MIEKGSVAEIGTDGSVTVEVGRNEACGSCAARGACNPAGSGKVHRARAYCAFPVSVGDTVEIEIADGAMMSAVLWAYLVPAALLLAGIFAAWFALAGTALEPHRDMLSAAAGLVGVALGFLVLRLINGRIQKPGTRAHSRFMIRVVRVIGPDEPC